MPSVRGSPATGLVWGASLPFRTRAASAGARRQRAGCVERGSHVGARGQPGLLRRLRKGRVAAGQAKGRARAAVFGRRDAARARARTASRSPPRGRPCVRSLQLQGVALRTPGLHAPPPGTGRGRPPGPLVGPPRRFGGPCAGYSSCVVGRLRGERRAARVASAPPHGPPTACPGRPLPCPQVATGAIRREVVCRGPGSDWRSQIGGSPGSVPARRPRRGQAGWVPARGMPVLTTGQVRR